MLHFSPLLIGIFAMASEIFKDGWEKLEVEMYRKDPELATLCLKDEMAEYLRTGDMAYVKMQLMTMAKAFGCTKLGKVTGLNRTTIYNILKGQEEPKLSNFLKIIHALGFDFYFRRATV
jgi:probable addiction module antidote protein